MSEIPRPEGNLETFKIPSYITVLNGTSENFRKELSEAFKKYLPRDLEVESVAGAEELLVLELNDLENLPEIPSEEGGIRKPCFAFGQVSQKNLPKEFIAELVKKGIHYIEGARREDMVSILRNYSFFGGNLDERSAFPLVIRIDPEGNGKMLTRVNPIAEKPGFTVETGFYDLQGDDFNLFIKGGRFGEQGKKVASKLSVCVSSQGGCGLSKGEKACLHCATGESEFFRNLTAPEIVEQVYAVLDNHPLGKDLKAQDPEKDPKRILQVSFMGEGEPLLNLPEVLKAIKKLNRKYPWVTFSFSTVGITKPLKNLLEQDLSDLSLQPQLSVHFPDSRREKFLPIAKEENSIQKTLPLMYKLAKKLGQRLTLNTVMFGEGEWQNNRAEDAHNLVNLVKDCLGEGVALTDFRFKVSEFNGYEGQKKYGFVEGQSDAFVQALESYGITVQKVPTRGAKVGAGCGNLVSQETLPKLVQIS